MLYVQYFCFSLTGHFAATKIAGSSAHYRWMAIKSSTYLPLQMYMYFGESLDFFPVYQEFCHLNVKVMFLRGEKSHISDL